MWTLPLKTCRAIVPPISAAAMLSRKLESTNTMASSASPPVQPSGRNAGISSGMRLFSKCRERIAKPISSRNRFARMTHSCCRCSARPRSPAPNLNPVKSELVDDDRREAGQRDLQRLVMEERDAEQRQGEQDEVDRDAEDVDRLHRRGGGRRDGRDCRLTCRRPQSRRREANGTAVRSVGRSNRPTAAGRHGCCTARAIDDVVWTL